MTIEKQRAKRVVVGITGATGAIYGVRTLQALAAAGVETHLVMSRWGQRTLEHECATSAAQIRALASIAHGEGNMGATISSGSFRTDGMVITPCSMRTLAAIAHGLSDNLLQRAADVTLKERRKLVLVARETPLSEIHLENMLKLARMGVVILPPVPAFYNRPASVDEVVAYTVARILDQFGIDSDEARRWDGDLRAGESVARMASKGEG